MNIGDTLGPYRVVGKLGEGGMGEVYRARDTKLDRDVALKVLPDLFASDVERLNRFEREAKTLASLNHPHIAQIHGLEEAGAVRALVMELVDGPTLADRIAQGAIPLEEALPIAGQIARALEAAHAQGIIHRDLKPANIKVRTDGTVKVLDFGLAKLGAAGSGGSSGARVAGVQDLLNSPTIATRMTAQGMILGTAAYMAPEQAKGRPVDRRADIWAFGVVLFEMLTGRPLFNGESAADLLGAVLRQDIDLAALPADTPPAVRRMLRRCLEREPGERLHDIADARIEIRDSLESREETAHVESAPTRRVALAASATALIALGTLAGWTLGVRNTPTQVHVPYRFTIPQLSGDNGVPAMAPDGRHLVYSAEGRLKVRALDGPDHRTLESTEGASEPFWSPDSRFIGFFAGGKLQRISLTGGPAETLAMVPAGWAVGTWSTNGTILVEVTENPGAEGWYLVEPGSTAPKKIRTFGADRPIDPDKAFPSFLPDGEHFLFTHPVGEIATLQIGSIRSDATRSLAPADSRGMFAWPGWVLYVRNGALLAQPFDPRALTTTGDAVTLVDQIDYFAPTGEASFSTSQEGTLVFRRRPGRSNLRWFDRDGRPAAVVLTPDYYDQFSASRDGRRLAAAITDPRRSTSDVWIVDLERNVSTRLTSSPRSEMNPQWSPDGSRLAFSTDWQGPPNLYVADAGGGQPRVLVPFDRRQQYAGGWTPDSRSVVYATRHEKSGRDIWIVDTETGARRVIVASEFNDQSPAVSPNGQSLAYVSNASGRYELYLRAFPGGGWETRLSASGGRDPVWRNDGRELFYYEPGGWIMAVQIEPGAGSPRPSVPARLFQIDERTYRSFDAAPDGRRFLINQAEPDGLSPPDEIVVDWTRLIGK